MEAMLSLDDIQKIYHSEWVLLENPEVDEHLDIVRGRVVFHSKDRDEVYRTMLKLRPTSSATIYTGTMPENTAIVL